MPRPAAPGGLPLRRQQVCPSDDMAWHGETTTLRFHLRADDEVAVTTTVDLSPTP